MFRSVSVTVQSGVCIIFVRSKTGIVGSNPIRVTDVCVFFFLHYAVLCT